MSSTLLQQGPPVHLLPVELLRQIFQQCCADSESSLFAAVLSHVCSRWRRIAIGEPELWTVLLIDLQEIMKSAHPISSMKLALLYFRRAKERAVTVEIKCVTSSTTTSRVNIALLLSQLSLLAQILDRHPEQIHRLKIRGEFGLLQIQNVFPTKLPNLSYLELDRCCPMDVVSILQRISAGATAIITGILPIGDAIPNSTAHCRASSLIFEFPWQGGQYVVDIFRCIVFPQITALRVSASQNFPGQHLPQGILLSMERSVPLTLQSLDLRFVWFMPEELGLMLGHLPGLKYLCVYELSRCLLPTPTLSSKFFNSLSLSSRNPLLDSVDFRIAGDLGTIDEQSLISAIRLRVEDSLRKVILRFPHDFGASVLLRQCLDEPKSQILTISHY
ncbi:hypothetical protein C8R42DRAFT_729746 [Lentinula raphanica]|nr:hypothetical protein C8R42DRAFT_729746 [Lentinula raphanica]